MSSLGKISYRNESSWWPAPTSTRVIRKPRQASYDIRDIDGCSPTPLCRSKKELLDQKLRKAIAEGREFFQDARKQTFLSKLQTPSPVFKGQRRKYLPQKGKYSPIRFIYKDEVTPKVGYLS